MENRIIKKVQESEILILDEIDRICKENDLTYFLIAGSLIGAVRHNGFIPWDDDLDIAMPREDYNKFIGVCKKELKGNFILDSFDTSKIYFRMALKVRLKDTEYIESELINYPGEVGIWVDVLPLDYSNKKSSIILSAQSLLKRFCCLGLVVKCNVFVNRKDISFKLASKFSSLFSYNFLHKLVDKVVTFQNNGNKRYVVNFASKYGVKKQIFDRDIYFPATYVSFCDKNYPVPNQYDKYLRQIYGDYMQIPPVEKREIHNPIKIKFSDGEEVFFDEKI